MANRSSDKKRKKRNTASGHRRSGRAHISALTTVGVLAAAALIILMLAGIRTGVFNRTAVEASDTSVVSASVLEARQREAEEKAAAEKAAAEKAAAEKKAQEEAEKKAAEEAAREKAEADLIAAHPEMKASITLQLPTGDVTIDRSTVQSWETDNGDGTWTKDENAWNQHIADYVANMAADIDTLGKSHQFNATGIGQIEVDGNDYYGWQVDQPTEIAQLTQELNEGKTVTREPNYLSRESAKADDNGGIGQTYCEIDASRQHLWIYQNGVLQFETDVVTGLMDESHYTPEGVYLLLDKQTNATLKGEQLPDGTRTYETPVNYWMPITRTGIGLHDASWKYVFGYGQNVWNGSHGCINLPSDVAGTVYDLLTMDTPIVIYYSEAYELRDAPPSALDQYLAAQQAAAEKEEKEKEEKEKEAESSQTDEPQTAEPTAAPTPEPTQQPSPSADTSSSAAETQTADASAPAASE